VKRKASKNQRCVLVAKIREKLMRGSKAVVKLVSSMSDADLAFIYLRD
jgi:hypothetical protein